MWFSCLKNTRIIVCQRNASCSYRRRGSLMQCAYEQSKVLVFASTLRSESKLCSKAPSKAVNATSLIFGRQSILKQPKHCGSRSRKREICFMRLNFILRRHHFLPRFVDKFSRRRLRISVCEKRVFGSNDGEVKKCIFAYFGVDKWG